MIISLSNNLNCKINTHIRNKYATEKQGLKQI